jgi:hypothetical protein
MNVRVGNSASNVCAVQAVQGDFKAAQPSRAIVSRYGRERTRAGLCRRYMVSTAHHPANQAAPFVAMMQTANLGDSDDATVIGFCTAAAVGRLFVRARCVRP